MGTTTTGNPVGGWQAVRASAGYVFVFMASVAAVGVLIAFASDDKGAVRYRPWISEKLVVLNQRPPVPNVVFVGASVTLTSIIPTVVDQAAAAEGCPDVRSINIGVPGARSFETAFMLDRVLELTDLQPGTIIVYDVASPEDFDFNRIAGSDRTPVSLRFRYLPDLISEVSLTWEGALRIFDFTRAAMGEALGMHALSDIASSWWHGKGDFSEFRVRDRGYVSASIRAADPEDKERKRFLKRYEKYEKILRRWKIAEFDDEPLPSNPFAARIREAGFVPIAYAAPYPTAVLAATALREQSADPSLPAISITTENLPQVYEGGRLWFDRTHLTDEGARLVSPLVGRDLCRIRKNS